MIHQNKKFVFHTKYCSILPRKLLLSVSGNKQGENTDTAATNIYLNKNGSHPLSPHTTAQKVNNSSKKCNIVFDTRMK